MGEEPFFIDSISDELENTILDEAERSFNQVVIYGSDVDGVKDRKSRRLFR